MRVSVVCLLCWRTCSDVLLEDNEVLVDSLSVKALPTKEYFRFTTRDGFGNIIALYSMFKMRVLC